MTAPPAMHPIGSETLLAYWLGELDAEREAQLDEHLIGCSDCSAELQALVDLAGAVRAAVHAGAVETVVPAAFVERLVAQGLRVREYRVAPSGRVACTVAPDDDLLVSRLQAPLAGVERLDLERTGADGRDLGGLHDVPFDAATDEVVIAHRMDHVRALPASTLHLRLVAVTPSQRRVVGEYTFHHTPWPGQGRD